MIWRGLLLLALLQPRIMCFESRWTPPLRGRVERTPPLGPPIAAQPTPNSRVHRLALTQSGMSYVVGHLGGTVMSMAAHHYDHYRVIPVWEV